MNEHRCRQASPHRPTRTLAGGIAPVLALVLTAAGATDTDPYLWLEEVDGERAIGWVEAQNARTAEALTGDERFRELYDQALTVLNSKSRIPSVTQRGEHLYNFWRDAEHPRGIYRRTTLASLGSDEPSWETVLDIDAMAVEDGIKWSFRGMSCLPPEHLRCLVYLSPGGGDASVVREFDAASLSFVEDGFQLPEAKSRVSWRDADSVYVGTDFGPGSMTESGYPRVVKLWHRGTPLAEAQTLYTGAAESVSAGAGRMHMEAGDIDLITEGLTFWTTAAYQLLDGEAHRLELPTTAVIEDGFQGHLVISLKEPWTIDGESHAAGTVLVADPARLRGGEGEIEVLFRPEAGRVIEDVDAAGNSILVTMLENVRGKVYRYRKVQGEWRAEPIAFPDNGAISVTSVDEDRETFFATFESFTTPATLFHVADDARPQLVKQQAESFDGDRFEVEQHFVASADGTEVPYFVVHATGLELDGSHPTHIFAYGGFRNALTPSYSGSYEALSGAYGKLWLERGGVFVLANIRGGGEYGPDWHQAALRENRPRAFEDFEAIARDLAARGYTSAKHIGIEGRSNGGLLVGATMTRAPELYGAVICGVPLLDMKRYHKLLAGASWMAEYGDPDVPEDWAFISGYSPYQNVVADRAYPPVLFYTSTRDDRVHPGHARKMAARMLQQGHAVWYYENTEGGHGGSSTNEQLAYRVALGYAHLWRALN